MNEDNPVDDSTDSQNRSDIPPGPDGIPVLGNTLDFVRQPMGFFNELATYGDVVHCEFPKIDAVAVFHPEYIGDVLLADEDIYRRWEFDELREIIDFEFAPEGLAFLDGQQWRKQRRLLQPMFGLDQLEVYGDSMVDYAQRTVNEWEDDEEVVLTEEFSELSLAILTHSLFNLDIRDKGEVVTEAAEAMNARVGFEGLEAIEMLLPSWVPAPAIRRYERAMDEFDETVDELIEDRQSDPEEYDDLLSRMLTAEGEDGYTMSESEIHDQMLTFLFAGHETTATAMTFAWLLLTAHPEKRRKLDEEVDEVLGGDAPSTEDLDDLEYTEYVVKEALRLYPPAGILFREATEDTSLGGYEVPQGTKVFLPQFTVHRDDRWYDNPDSFRPERWSEKSEEERLEYAYFPFGGGPHHCIGMRFAMMELKLVIPIIAQEVEFELLSSPSPETELAMTLQPANEVRARVHK